MTFIKALGFFTKIDTNQLDDPRKWHQKIGESFPGFSATDLCRDMTYCHENSLCLADEISEVDKELFFANLDKLLALEKIKPGFINRFPYGLMTTAVRDKKYFELISYRDDPQIIDNAFRFLSDTFAQLNLEKERDTELLQIDPRKLAKLPSVIMTFIIGALKATTVSMPGGKPDDIQACFTMLKKMIVDSVKILRIISEYLISRKLVKENDLKASLNAYSGSELRLHTDPFKPVTDTKPWTEYLQAYTRSLAATRNGSYNFADISDQLKLLS